MERKDKDLVKENFITASRFIEENLAKKVVFKLILWIQMLQDLNSLSSRQSLDL